MHRNGSLGYPDDFQRCPGKSSSHTEEEEDGEDNFRRRVNLSKLPQTQDAHLGVSNEDYTEHNALQDGEPAISEVLEFVTLHPALLHCKLAECFEKGDGNDGEDNEDTEEGKSSHENISGFHLGTECDTLDALDNVVSRDGGRAAAAGSSLGQRLMSTGKELDGRVNRAFTERALLNLN